jgi:uncharacterized protein (TIGR02001 family)
MKKIIIAAAASMLLSGAASAADLSTMPVKAVAPAPVTPLWDVAFGVTGTSDYLFRGISQTNNNPAIQGFVELQLFDWVYFNVWASNQNWVENFLWDGNSSLEVDFAGGLRHTWGNFSLDVGAAYYTYPGSSNSIDPTTLLKTGLGSTDYNYWEIYAKPTYVVAPWLTVGLNLFWSSDFASTGTDGTALSGTVKVPLPAFGPGGDFGWYLSGEFGHQWLDTAAYSYSVTNFAGITYDTSIPGYNWWNAGVGFTYKAATIDVRYSGTDLSGNDCAFIIGNNNACGDKIVASLSFATSFNALK